MFASKEVAVSLNGVADSRKGRNTLIIMAKKNKPNLSAKSVYIQNQVSTAYDEPFQSVGLPAWLSGFKIQAIIIGILAFIFYSNTIQNEFALDDYAVIIKNEPVYNGIAGLNDIFTKDTYDSYYKQTNDVNGLSGGRYRPLSVATFAIEQEFLGTVPKGQVDSIMQHNDWGALFLRHDQRFISGMHIRHFFNVLWFTLSVLVLLYFLRTVVFKNDPLLALFTTILFTIHPIHTEVVANLKSRDEILSLLFISLTFIFAFKYQEQKEKKRWLYFGLISYFLAFLSKEYAVSLVVLLPLSFFLFNRYSLSKSIMASLPYVGVVFIYIILRLQVIAPVNEDANNSVSILADPYAYASATEKLATLIATPLDYLRLLVFPHPLSADYSYNSIPYKDFTSPVVWLSLVAHIALFRAFFYYLKRKNVLSFAIAFYFVNLLLICNLIFNIGGTMGERLIYHSSVGFSIALAFLLLKGMNLLKSVFTKRIALGSLAAILIVLCGFKTINRNANWKNDETLFKQDIKVVPNSVIANANVGMHLIVKSDLEKNEKVKKDNLHNAITLLNKAILLDNRNATSYYNKAIAYTVLAEPDSVVSAVKSLHDFYPNYPGLRQLYYQAGKLFFSKKEYYKAKTIFEIILKIYPKNTEVQQALRTVNDSLKTG